MIKITRFTDIPQFTSWGNYVVDVGLDYLQEWLENKDTKLHLNLNPDFQRAHVWTEDQKIKFMEFVLRGGKSANTLLFNCPGWMTDFRGPFELVDGKQRISAVLDFLNNRIQVFNSYYREYTDKMRIVNNTFRIVVNDLKTRREVLNWYLDLNYQGTPHTKAELNRVRSLLKAESHRLNLEKFEDPNTGEILYRRNDMML